MIGKKIVSTWDISNCKPLQMDLLVGGEYCMTSTSLHQTVKQRRVDTEANLSYKGFNIDFFCDSWHEKLKHVQSVSSEFAFAGEVQAFTEWVVRNGCLREELTQVVSNIAYLEQFESIIKIVHKYDEQYELLLDGCSEYESFRDVVEFLQDLPHEFLATLRNIVVKYLDTSCGSFFDESWELPDFKQEKSTNTWKEGVEQVSTPSIFFIGG